MDGVYRRMSSMITLSPVCLAVWYRDLNEAFHSVDRMCIRQV